MDDAHRITLTSAELLTVRDAMRGLNGHLDQLRGGEKEKLVLLKQNEIVGVVVSAERYAVYEDLRDTVGDLLDAELHASPGAFNDATSHLSHLLGKL